MSIIRDGFQNVDLDFPVVTPTLILDFANSQKLDSRIKFSRGTGIATRVNRNRLIETVAANQPRFDYDPVTGECKGLLIEESRQNLLTYSNDFSNAAWINSTLFFSYNNVTGLDGITSASTFTANSTSSLNELYQNFICTASTTYTFSFYVKLGTLPASSYKIAVYNNTGASFIASDVVPTQTLSSNSWTRVSYTFTTPAGCVSARVYPYRNAVFVQNNGTFYLWGTQVEQGAFSTSYIPTSGSTVTRSADLAEMTGTNFSSWYNPDEGTLFANALSTTNSTLPTGIAALNNSGDSTNNRVDLRYYQSGNSQVVFNGVNSGGSQLSLISGFSLTNPKFIVSYASQNVNFAVNALLISSMSSAFIPSPLVNRLLIGTFDVGNTYYLNGTISRLTYLSLIHI